MDDVGYEHVLSEIEDEVRRKRSSGELPPDFEAQLDAAFAALAPPGAHGVTLEQLIDNLEHSSFVWLLTAPEVGRPARRLAKRVIRRALRPVVLRAARREAALLEVLRQIVARGDELAMTVPASSDVPVGDPPADVARWAGLCCDTFDGLGGRIMQGEAGDGRLVDALKASGLDAYAVEPRRHLANALVLRGVDVRNEPVRTHLDRVVAGVLDGVVLSGCVDRLAAAAQQQLVRQARRTLNAGGRIVIITTHRELWNTRGGVDADVAAGHPLSPETWLHLLAQAGFVDPSHHDGEGQSAIVAAAP